MNPVSPSVHLRRSFLYVPGSEEKKLAKAAALGFVGKLIELPVVAMEQRVLERARRASRVGTSLE